MIDKYELKGFLTRPGSGSIAMSDEDEEAILSTLTALFDANDDGKLQIAEVASALMAQG